MDITDVDQFMLAEEQAMTSEIEKLEAEEDDFEMTESQYETLNGMFDESIDEYMIDPENLHEEADSKDLVEIMNDDGGMLTAEQLGISLGLAEEIESENLFRYIDLLTKQCKKIISEGQQKSERDVPIGSTLVPIKMKERKRTKFDRYVDQIIAEDRGKIPT